MVGGRSRYNPVTGNCDNVLKESRGYIWIYDTIADNERWLYPVDVADLKTYYAIDTASTGDQQKFYSGQTFN